MILFLLKISVLAVVSTHAVNSCYYCADLKSVCTERYNKGDKSKMDCGNMTLNVNLLNESYKLELAIRDDIIYPMFNVSDAEAHETDGCVIIDYHSNDDGKKTDKTLQMCISKIIIITDVCNYLVKGFSEIDEALEVEECLYCTKDYCNRPFSATESIFTHRLPALVISMVLLILCA